MTASVSSSAQLRPDYDVAVIGAGFAGLYALHKLRSLGFSVLGIEKGQDVGGVWYWNRYPGARCDCESYYYSYSFSEELQRDWRWSLRYSEQPEILRYLAHVADRFHLRPHIRFSTRLKSARFEEYQKCWQLTFDRGEPVRVRFLISAMGCLSEIKKPDIPGIERFSGQILHTAAWPHEEVDLKGKRVGIIGTGASGVQTISRIAPEVQELTVFQRTANWVIPVWNKATDAAFHTWVQEHYAEIRHRCFNSAGGVPFPPADHAAVDLNDARRQEILQNFWQLGGIRFFSAFSDLFTEAQTNELVCEFVRNYIRKTVKDKTTAETLIPTDHPIGVKRPPMDDDYYATFNRPNVSLVDLRSTPIVSVEEDAILTRAARYRLDTLILATGFDALTGALLAVDVRGRKGRTLQEAWADGARSYLGLAVAGFPNLFTVTGPLSPSVLANMPSAIEQHVNWIADCLCAMRKSGSLVIEAEEEPQKTWTEHVAEVANGTLYRNSKSWYFGSNVPGKPRQFGVYVGGFGAYSERCRAVAEAGYEGFARI